MRKLLLVSVLALLASGAGAGALVDAARNGDAETVRRLLREGADVEATLADGSSALLWASYRNDAALVAALLEAGADPAAGNDYGITPLYEASRNGNVEILTLLLDAGLDPDTGLREGETPLMVAALGGNREAVRLLLERGADIDHRESWRGQSALMWAAANNHPETLALLLEAGAKVDMLSTEFDYRELPPKRGSVGMIFPRGGFSALMFAARNGSLEAAELLLAQGADPDLAEPDGITPLIMALTNFHFDLAALLLEHGADVNLRDASDRGALYAAVDIHRPDYTNRPSPLVSDKHDSVDIIRLLLADPSIEVDAPINSPIDPRAVLDGADFALGAGTTPFIRAARAADVEVMQLLIEHGADIHHRTDAGTDALMLASGLQWRDGKTRGTEEEVLAAVTLLLERGADVKLQDARGNTALHGAAYRGVDALISLLVAHGAEVGTANADGETPLDVAAGVGGTREALTSTVNLLRELAVR